MTVKLQHFIERYEGSSFPTLVRTDDGRRSVLKMRGAGNGAAGLISEFLVNRLASAGGLPVPDVSVIHIDHGFPWKFGTDEFHDLVQKSFGPNLGIEWLEGAKVVPPDHLHSLPDDFVSQLVTIDLVFANVDRTVQSGNVLKDSHGRLWIVDHGSCRFLFQSIMSLPSMLPADHVFAGSDETFSPRWLSSVDSTAVASAVDEIPTQWLTETRLTKERVGELLIQSLRLARPNQR